MKKRNFLKLTASAFAIPTVPAIAIPAKPTGFTITYTDSTIMSSDGGGIDFLVEQTLKIVKQQTIVINVEPGAQFITSWQVFKALVDKGVAVYWNVPPFSSFTDEQKSTFRKYLSQFGKHSEPDTGHVIIFTNKKDRFSGTPTTLHVSLTSNKFETLPGSKVKYTHARSCIEVLNGEVKDKYIPLTFIRIF